MNQMRKMSVLLLVVLLPVGTTLAADIQSRTTAGILETDGQSVLTQVDTVLLVELEQPPILSRDDVIVTWRRAGGIQPQPFRIAIPAGCFVETRNAFVVRDTGCGVRIILDGTRLTTDVFGARLFPPEPVVPPDPIVPPEPVRLRVRLELALSPAAAAELLSTLGGATVIVQIGAERGISPASEIQSKSGISPQPF